MISLCPRHRGRINSSTLTTMAALKTLRSLTLYEFICRAWTKEHERFRLNPSHQTSVSYSRPSCASAGVVRRSAPITHLGDRAYPKEAVGKE